MNTCSVCKRANLNSERCVFCGAPLGVPPASAPNGCEHCGWPVAPNRVTGNAAVDGQVTRPVWQLCFLCAELLKPLFEKPYWIGLHHAWLADQVRKQRNLRGTL